MPNDLTRARFSSKEGDGPSLYASASSPISSRNAASSAGSSSASARSAAASSASRACARSTAPIMFETLSRSSRKGSTAAFAVPPTMPNSKTPITPRRDNSISPYSLNLTETSSGDFTLQESWEQTISSQSSRASWGSPRPLNGPWTPLAEIAVAVGIHRDDHDQSSGSTRSISSRA